MIHVPPFFGGGKRAPALRRQLTLAPLVMVVFFTVCGGAYGLEPLVQESGPGMALLLIAVTPLIWALPTAAMSAELSAAIPAEGGYYVWVKRGLGSFWGFQEGWWSWLASFVDMAIYPVLFASYLEVLLEALFGITVLEENPLARWGVILALTWSLALLNVRGVRGVGRMAVVCAVLVLLPFAVMSALGLIRLAEAPFPFWEPFVPPEESLWGAFGVGLFVVMWNYQGWDGVSTVNGEVVDPRRVAPRALWIALPLVVLAYFLPVLAGLVGTPDWTQWEEGFFPAAGAAVGGQWLGVWLGVAGLVSAAGLYGANLLSVSRLPFVMADDGYLPSGLARLHPRYGTPWVSILLCAVVHSVFALGAFASLVVIDVMLYAAGLLLEFAALIALRLKAPHLRRPVRVPGGWPGVILATALPMAVVTLAVVSTLQTEGAAALYLALAALASGPLLYPVCALLFKRGRPDVDVAPEPDAAAAGAWPGRLARLAPAAQPRWTP